MPRKHYMSIVLLILVYSHGYSQKCWSGDCENGYGIMGYPDDSRYVGNFKEGKFHGHGMYFSPHDSVSYEGDFENGTFHGKGAYSDLDIKYTGDWKEGRFDGAGILLMKSGNKYEGEFQGGLMQGAGVYTYSYGLIHKGLFVKYDDKKGQFFKGYMIVGNDSAYIEGWLLHGTMEGEGTKIFSNGDKYVGHFEANLFNGKGVYTYANGKKLEGYFRKGEFIGE